LRRADQAVLVGDDLQQRLVVAQRLVVRAAQARAGSVAAQDALDVLAALAPRLLRRRGQEAQAVHGDDRRRGVLALGRQRRAVARSLALDLDEAVVARGVPAVAVA